MFVRYYNTQKLNEKSNIFSFGIVLLKLITSQPAIVKNDEPIPLVHWVSPKFEMGDIESIVDKRLQGDFDVNSIQKALELAMTCTTPTSSQRATMSLVLLDIKECLAMELCKVEFNQPFYWLYSVPNLLVFQHLVTLYLGGFFVSVVSEIEC